MSNKKTREQFIKEATEKHKNLYNYDEVIYENTKKKVKIICKIHGQFEQSPGQHIKGNGCRQCGYINNGNNCRKSKDNFIKEAINKHGNIYNYNKVVYKNANSKVIIECKLHGDFEQRPTQHLRGQGCSYCSKNKIYIPEWIEKVNIKHNNKYDYSESNILKSTIKIKIKCPYHGIFMQTPEAHLQGTGCKRCARAYTPTQYINLAKKKHNNTYTYNNTIYIDSSTDIIITCKEHGDFIQNPTTHLQGHGCKKCSNRYSPTTEEFIINAKNIHGNKYDYSKTIYNKAHEKLIIICKKHGEFLQKPVEHIYQRCGCPECKKKFSSIQEFIDEANIIHNYNYDYSKVNFNNINDKIIIRCKVHNYEFQQRLDSHIRGMKCRKCSGNYNWDTKEWIEEAKKIHNNLYDYSDSIYINKRNKINIKCIKHGNFLQNPNSHINGSGCHKCQYCNECQLFRTGRGGVLCEYCKPNKDNKKYQKTKEMEIVKYLRDNIEDKEFIHNKSVSNNCNGTHQFPDILFECNYYNLIVEIDEFKHRGSGYECDEKRMYDITAKLGLPTIFIRYNPDNKISDKNELLKVVQEYLSYEDEFEKQLNINEDDEDDEIHDKNKNKIIDNNLNLYLYKELLKIEDEIKAFKDIYLYYD